MLEDFLDGKLYIRLNSVQLVDLNLLEKAIGDKRWAHGAGLNSEFTRKHRNVYICCRWSSIYFSEYKPKDVFGNPIPFVNLTDFLEDYKFGSAPFKDIDVMTVFAEE